MPQHAANIFTDLFNAVGMSEWGLEEDVDIWSSVKVFNHMQEMTFFVNSLMSQMNTMHGTNVF